MVAAHRIPQVMAKFGVVPNLVAFERCLAAKTVGEGNALTLPDAVDAALSLWSAERLAPESHDHAAGPAGAQTAAATAGPETVGGKLYPPALHQPRANGTLSRPPAVAAGEPALSVQVRSRANTLRSVLSRGHARPASAAADPVDPGGAPLAEGANSDPEGGPVEEGVALPAGWRLAAAAASSDRLHAMPLQKTVVASLSAPQLWKPEAAKREETRSVRRTTRRRRGVAERDRTLAGGVCGAVNLVARQTATEMARRAREDEALDQWEAVRMSRKLQRRTRRRLLRFHEQNRRYHLREVLVQKRRVQALGAYLQDARVAETCQRRAQGPAPLPRGPPSSPLMIMRELERRGLPPLPDGVLPPVFVPHRTATVTKAKLQPLPMDGAGILDDGGTETRPAARSTQSPVTLITPPPVAHSHLKRPGDSGALASAGHAGGVHGAGTVPHAATTAAPGLQDEESDLPWPPESGGEAGGATPAGTAAEDRAVARRRPVQYGGRTEPEREWTATPEAEGRSPESGEAQPPSSTYASPTQSAALRRRGSIQALNLRSALQNAEQEEAGPPLPSLAPVRSSVAATSSGAGNRIDGNASTADDSPSTTVLDRVGQMSRRAASMRHSFSEPAASTLSADTGAGSARVPAPAGHAASPLTSHNAAQLRGEAAVEALVQYGRHLASTGGGGGDGTWAQGGNGAPEPTR